MSSSASLGSVRSQVPTTLVLRALGLGDLLVAVPALRALRRARPDDRLVLAAPGALEPLTRLVDAVDELLPCAAPAELPAAWSPRPSPGLGVNLHGDGEASHEALAALAPGRLVGERVEGRGPGHEQPHERERWCALLARAGLCTQPPDPADLRLGEHRPGPRAPVVVHPGAAYGAKRWPVARYAAVAAALAAPHRPVVVTGGPDERGLTAALTRAAGLPAASDLGGREGLAALVERVRTAALVVCGDTGVAHLACAFGTPSVVLFGPVPATRWGPPPGPHRVLCDDAARRGDPFAADPDPALLGVEVDDVLAEARELLDLTGPGRPGRGPARGGGSPCPAAAARGC